MEPGYSPKKQEDDEERHGITEYQKAIGSLLWAELNSHPDIAYAINKLSRYSPDPSQTHWNAIKHLFQYFKKTLDYELCIYSKDNKQGLGTGNGGGIVCFADVDLDTSLARGSLGGCGCGRHYSEDEVLWGP
jgi:hypothetical protein